MRSFLDLESINKQHALKSKYIYSYERSALAMKMPPILEVSGNSKATHIMQSTMSNESNYGAICCSINVSRHSDHCYEKVTFERQIIAKMLINQFKS